MVTIVVVQVLNLLEAVLPEANQYLGQGDGTGSLFGTEYPVFVKIISFRFLQSRQTRRNFLCRVSLESAGAESQRAPSQTLRQPRHQRRRW